MMKKLISTISCVLVFSMAQSQEVTRSIIGTSGNNNESSSLSISWTIGEPVTQTFTSPYNTLTQGFQQGEYEITAIEDAENYYDLNVDVELFPVPAKHILNVIINDPEQNTYTLHLKSANGTNLQTKNVNDVSSRIILDLNKYASGIYFLLITNTDQSLSKTYKIEKIK